MNKVLDLGVMGHNIVRQTVMGHNIVRQTVMGHNIVRQTQTVLLGNEYEMFTVDSRKSSPKKAEESLTSRYKQARL